MSYEDAIALLEPAAGAGYGKGGEIDFYDACTLSRAISLKRIADAIDGDDKRMGIADALANLVRSKP